jgi:hypothetical protein
MLFKRKMLRDIDYGKEIRSSLTDPNVLYLLREELLRDNYRTVDLKSLKIEIKIRALQQKIKEYEQKIVPLSIEKEEILKRIEENEERRSEYIMQKYADEGANNKKEEE